MKCNIRIGDYPPALIEDVQQNGIIQVKISLEMLHDFQIVFDHFVCSRHCRLNRCLIIQSSTPFFGRICHLSYLFWRLQSWKEYIGQALVFLWSSAIRENFNFYFSSVSASVNKILSLDGTLGAR